MRHVKRQIKDKSRRTHWSMKLAYKNLSVVAAIMALQSHMKNDISSLGESDRLLPFNLEHFVPCINHSDRGGSYLYYDTNRGLFVRSGKVSGQGFSKRDKEHLKCVKAATASSHFYRVFPSLSSPRASKQGKKGTFESLTQVIAAGFD